jgi:hypothetical protein
MVEEYENQRRKQVTRMRSTMDLVMGVVFMLIGVYFLVYDRMGWNVFNRDPSSIDYAIAALFLLYGGWRLYRGYKKDYFRE